jgi:GNAT superfamily N-acetyltransferase
VRRTGARALLPDVGGRPRNSRTTSDQVFPEDLRQRLAGLGQGAERHREKHAPRTRARSCSNRIHREVRMGEYCAARWFSRVASDGGQVQSRPERPGNSRISKAGLSGRALGRHESNSVMQETPKHIKRLMREWAGIAHDRELSSAYRWSIDTSVYVEDAYRRRGVGRGLYVSLFAILAAQGYVNAYAGIALPNPASVALHESLRFEKVGVYRRVGYKLGQWHDVGWWQRILRELEQSPNEPYDLPTVSRRPDCEALMAQGLSSIRAEPAPRCT